MRTVECPNCLRYRGDLTCDAFSTGIPEVILTGQVSHGDAYDGDSGLTFAPIPGNHEEPMQKSLYDHTKAIADSDAVGYARAKEVIMRHGYHEVDFEEGGPLYGVSTNGLIEMVREKRDAVN